MYTDMVPKISYQLRIGSVYLNTLRRALKMSENDLCQFLIGNVYHEKVDNSTEKKMYQFLIGNVYQLVLSVSNYDTTPFSSQNQSKIFKKSVDLQQLRLCKPLILQHSILFLNLSLTSTGFLSKNYAN